MTLRRRFSLFRSTALVYLIFFVFTTSEILQAVPVFNLAVNILRVLLGGILIYNYIFTEKKNLFVNIIVLWQFLYVCSALANSCLTISRGFYFVNAVAIVVFVEEGLRINKRKFLRCGRNWFSFLLTLNLFQVVFLDGYASSSGPVYIMGLRIAFTLYAFVAILFSIAYDNFFCNRRISRYSITVILLAVANLFSEMVVTGLISLLAMLFCYIILKNTKNKKLKWFLFLASVFAALSTIFQPNFINLFSGFLGLFGKDITISSRIYIWKQAVALIPQKIILGYGKDDFIVPMLSLTTTHPAHNEILNILIQGGALSLSCFVVLMVITIKKCSNADKLSQVCVAFLFALTIMMITEVASVQTCFYFFMALCFFLNENNLTKIKNGTNSLRNNERENV